MKKGSPRKQHPSEQPESDLPGLAQPAQRALASAGIRKLEQLTRFSEAEIKELHGIGPNALVAIRRALADQGLSFAEETGTKNSDAQKETPMKKPAMKDGMTPARHIDQLIDELGDWRGSLIARLRKLILQAVPELTEEWKWDTPVWSRNGNVVAAGVFKDHVKLNFFKGASLRDPQGLFNAGLDAKATRAIDFREGDKIDEAALKDLVRAAAAQNASGGRKK